MTQHSDKSPGPEELRQQVERTRAELGRTVEALAAKADVKARAREKAAEVGEHAARTAGELKAAAARFLHRTHDGTPGPVRQRTAQGAQLARDNRTVVLVAAGVVLVAWLVLRRKD
ncbi:DUF3618 domain-containing protein [Streptomyces longwoodensis]|uniref:DUF3618 domain-containing protein n=1 Tax=Streptomyces longwoodensis TaxID=68231 RepID=UPI00384E3005